jgi:hypothetical protein
VDVTPRATRGFRLVSRAAWKNAETVAFGYPRERLFEQRAKVAFGYPRHAPSVTAGDGLT